MPGTDVLRGRRSRHDEMPGTDVLRIRPQQLVLLLPSHMHGVQCQVVDVWMCSCGREQLGDKCVTLGCGLDSHLGRPFEPFGRDRAVADAMLMNGKRNPGAYHRARRERGPATSLPIDRHGVQAPLRALGVCAVGPSVKPFRPRDASGAVILTFALSPKPIANDPSLAFLLRVDDFLRSGYEFRLSEKGSAVITPDGVIIPFDGECIRVGAQLRATFRLYPVHHDQGNTTLHMMLGNSDPKDYVLAIFDTATDVTVVSPLSSGFVTSSQGPPVVLAGLNGQTDAYQRGTVVISPLPAPPVVSASRRPWARPTVMHVDDAIELATNVAVVSADSSSQPPPVALVGWDGQENACQRGTVRPSPSPAPPAKPESRRARTRLRRSGARHTAAHTAVASSPPPIEPLDANDLEHERVSDAAVCRTGAASAYLNAPPTRVIPLPPPPLLKPNRPASDRASGQNSGDSIKKEVQRALANGALTLVPSWRALQECRIGPGRARLVRLVARVRCRGSSAKLAIAKHTSRSRNPLSMCAGTRTQLASDTVDPLPAVGACKPVLYAFVPAWLGVYGDFPSRNAKGQRNMVAVGYDKSIAIDVRVLK